MSPLRMRLVLAAFVCALPFGSPRAATLPTGFAETRVATGIASPTAMAFAPDGRVFVAQQSGALRVVKNGALLSQPFLTLSVNSSGERGLLGVAFDPNFASNAFVYVYYTTSTSPVHNRLSRFTASASNPDVVAAGSEVQLLNLPSLSSATNHNGGAIHFGTDGKLYIAVGDNANGANSQSLSTTLGKVLRVNADGSIPSDNPFLGQTTGINQSIWAMGLRNPFTFAVDRTNGRIHINDVGQDSWEEVNLGAAGANYGWPQIEGPNPAGVAGRTYPIHNYQNAGSNCAIVGAAFYRPVTATFPAEYAGRYFFGDYCGGFIRTLSPPLSKDWPGQGDQPGSELRGRFGGSCDFGALSQRACWAYSGGWDTLLYHIRPGRDKGADTLVQVWAAHPGEKSYTKIWDQPNVNLPFDPRHPRGHNALICSGYLNKIDTGPGVFHRYAQIVFSLDPIPCPQA